jgi:hypothetical protein
MSNETARRVTQAEKAVSKLRTEADKCIQDCLNSIASELPGRLDDIARRTAQNEPNVAKSLGKDGLRILRQELAESAQRLGSEIANAANKVKWPQALSEYSNLSTRNIQTALFEFLYGPRVDRIATVFKRRGFSTGETSGHPQSLIYPQYLYQEKMLAPVVEALNSLGKAERAFASAKAADDEDTVASLWESSELDK